MLILGLLLCYQTGMSNKALLCRHGDVESNPGPEGKLRIGTYNASGCRSYDKLKRITTWIFTNLRTDRLVFSLQETHIDSKASLPSFLWREGLIISPSLNNARGVITFYNNNLFDDILYQDGTKDGRSTWIIGSFNNFVDMFVSIYAPNSGKNAEFYTSFFNKVNNLAAEYEVDNIYITGDFNLVLKSGNMAGRTQTTYENNLVKIVEDETYSLGLVNLMGNNNKFTWNRANKHSTLDYILGPANASNLVINNYVKWGIDKSDHALIYVDIAFNLEKGPGLFRPNLAFLDNPDLRASFESELYLAINDCSESWDPHMTLEYCKVMIRTKAMEFSVRYRKRCDDRHESISQELTKLHNIKNRILCNNEIGGYININDLNNDILQLQLELDDVLIEKTKILASKSRVKWLELGERSNKYFMNINKSFHNKSFVRTMINPDSGSEVSSLSDKLNIAFNFYKSLYSKQPV